MRLHKLLLPAALLSLNPAFAQSVPEVLVTGTIINDASVFDRLPREVITAEDIAALNPSNTVALLRSIPGVDVTQQGGEGGVTTVSLRGGDPNFTVVMIDGVKVDDPTNSRGGGYDFAGLDPLIIERIEVLFGSYSAVYGSDALAGVISVTTRSQGGADGAAVDVEIGSDSAGAAAVNLAGTLGGNLRGGLSAAIRQGNEAVEGDSLERQQLSLSLARIAPDAGGLEWGLRLFASNADTTSFPLASGGDQLAVIREPEIRDTSQRIVSGDLGWSPLESWQTRLTASWNEYQEDSDSPGIAPGAISGVPPILSSRTYERANAVFSNTVSVSEPLVLGLGGELIREDGEIRSVIDFGFPIPADFDLIRDTWALFAEASLAAHEQINVIASLRHDDTEDIESTTGRLAVNLDFSDSGTAVWLIYGESFKLPSLFAIGDPLTGNPDLVPEESQNLEFRVEQSAYDDRLTLSASVYRNEFKDLVDFDVETFSHVNRSSVTTKGVDFGLALNVSERLNIHGNLAYLDTETEDGTELERRPEWKGSLTGTWQATDSLLFTARGVYNGDFYDVSVPTGLVEMDNYTYLDATAIWSVTEKIDVKLMLSNIFDKAYEEAVGFSNPGQQIRLGISARL
jgi:vitamin B12 transporter